MTLGSPFVSVPVLSNSTAPTVRMLLQREPVLDQHAAAGRQRSVAMATTSGIARPSACGQAITSTVMVRMTASSGLPMSAQTTAVMIAGAAAANAEQPAGRAGRPAAAPAMQEFCASVDQPLDAGQRACRRRPR